MQVHSFARQWRAVAKTRIETQAIRKRPRYCIPDILVAVISACFDTQVFTLLLEQLAPLVYREDEFLTDFLQINDAALTFADYMNLDNYFRRQASRSAGLSQGTMKLVRGAMELIFGFLPTEIKAWLDGALAKDDMCDYFSFIHIPILIHLPGSYLAF